MTSLRLKEFSETLHDIERAKGKMLEVDPDLGQFVRA